MSKREWATFLQKFESRERVVQIRGYHSSAGIVPTEKKNYCSKHSLFDEGRYFTK